MKPAANVHDAVMSAPDGLELRVVLPTGALPAARPDYYSQRNCHLLGITGRQFLELLRRPDAPPVAPIGKLRLVRREALLAFIDRMARHRDGIERSVDGADEVLREIGCASVRRARSR
ncbi:hypothetical protein [Sandaracinus amylolyticus]|uniref:hypothetical protein n=1 Tax=Sandaracinus amylolyticus TaxID=927083 RepID=UPI00069EF7DB|nr:hypothetical protein [Sandaracinus amylolyticus]